MTRGEFIRTASAAAMATAMGKALGDQRKVPADFAALQSEIDEITPQHFKDYLSNGAHSRPDYAALARLDDAFDKIQTEIRAAVATDKPAVWLVYNMGTVVKTPKTCFAIDLKHRKAPQLAPLLDFALITHNHGDHYTEAFYRAMNGAGKTVISNFKDNYGVKNWRVDGGFTRAVKTFNLKDTTVRTSLTDHNDYLVDFTTAFEIRIGDYVIYHSGDCSNVDKLNPAKRPDLWIVHPYCGMKVADGVRKLHPSTTVIAHLNELSHASDKWRWTYQDGLRAKDEAEAVGGKAVVPIWGERIA